MGRVEQVRDHDLLRDVAVKHLHSELIKDPRMLDQFLWEARVTAYLEHPNTVPLHDLGLTSQGELYITMKLVRGVTLQTVITDARETRAEQFALAARLRMFLQLCNGISFAHSRGVLHRDLKPANVMVGAFGEILITDWGLALPLPDASGDTLRAILPDALATQSAGTPLYMSPEQAAGEPLDARSDLYALGVILYELIALRSPYDASSVREVIDQVMNAQTIPLAEAMADVSSSVAAVVEKAMALRTQERYPTVRALSKDVEAVLDGHTPAAEQVSLVRRATRYYVARDPAMARLRVIDIDLWAFSGMLLGTAVTVLVARWTPLPAWVGWVSLLMAFLVAATPTFRWLRLRASRPQAREPQGHSQ